MAFIGSPLSKESISKLTLQFTKYNILTNQPTPIPCSPLKQMDPALDQWKLTLNVPTPTQTVLGPKAL